MDEFFDYDSNTKRKQPHHVTMKQLEQYIAVQHQRQEPAPSTTTTTNQMNKGREENEEEVLKRDMEVKKEQKKKEVYFKTTRAPSSSFPLHWIPTRSAPKTLHERVLTDLKRMEEKKQKSQFVKIGSFNAAHFPVILGEASSVISMDRSSSNTVWEDYDAATRYGKSTNEQIFSCAPHLPNTFLIQHATTHEQQPVPIFVRRSPNGQLAEVRLLFEDDMEDMNEVKLD